YQSLESANHTGNGSNQAEHRGADANHREIANVMTHLRVLLREFLKHGFLHCYFSFSEHADTDSANVGKRTLLPPAVAVRGYVIALPEVLPYRVNLIRGNHARLRRLYHAVDREI